MKKISLLLVTAAISAITCLNAFAGEWKQDTTGWWYDNGDTTYLKDGWSWVNGKCYYFTSEGYCLLNTITPDGYQVDESGSWVVNGIVQIQEKLETVTGNALQFVPPSGYYFYEQKSYFTAYVKDNPWSLIEIYDYEYTTDISELEAATEQFKDEVLDFTINSEIGPYTSKSYRQLSSGTWTCYRYEIDNYLDVPGTMTIYARFTDTNCQMVFFVGHISEIDTDGVMNVSIK